MANSHYERCLINAKAHYAHLQRSVKNKNAIEGIMKSFLEQPAYDGYRAELLRAVMAAQ